MLSENRGSATTKCAKCESPIGFILIIDCLTRKSYTKNNFKITIMGKDFNMNTYLVTGVAGFIGSNFAHYIAKKYPDATIIGVDNLSPYSCRANISSLEESGRLIFVQADIARDPEKIDAAYKEYKPAYVINFAAESHNDRAIVDPTSFVYSNVLGAQAMLEASRINGVHRHIHISTIEVYGEQAPDVEFFNESSPLNAKTPYSSAKAGGDLMVRAYMQTYPEMDIYMTHCANNYGAYQFPEKLIPLSVINILNGGKIKLYGDGLQKRDWLHVEDHCKAVDLILQMEKKPPIGEGAAFDSAELPIYDISARHEVTNKALAEVIVDELGVDFDTHVEYVADRPNHDRRYLIDPSKIESDLNFKPDHTFEEGIRETVRWYKNNEKWWKDIAEKSGDLSIDWSKH